MGKIQSKKMDFKHKNFIDYAFTDEKSDFNDIFLLSNCEAYMGSDAGLGDIPLLSGKPRFLINYSLTTLHLFIMAVVKCLEKIIILLYSNICMMRSFKKN